MVRSKRNASRSLNLFAAMLGVTSGVACDVEHERGRPLAAEAERGRAKASDQNEHEAPCLEYYATVAACGTSGIIAGLWDGCTKTPAYGVGKGVVTSAACLAAVGIGSVGEFFEVADACGRSLVPAYDACEEPITGLESAGCHEDPFLSCREIMDCRSIWVNDGGARQRRCDQWPAEQDPRCTDGYIQCLKNTYALCNEPDTEAGSQCSIPSGDFDLSYDVSQSDLDLVLTSWGDETLPDGWVHEAPIGIVAQAELDKVLHNWGHGTTPPPTGSCAELAAMCPEHADACDAGDEDACIAEECHFIGSNAGAEACAEVFGGCASVCG